MHHSQAVRNRIDAALFVIQSTSALGHLAVANPKRVFAYVVDAGNRVIAHPISIYCSVTFRNCLILWHYPAPTPRTGDHIAISSHRWMKSQ